MGLVASWTLIAPDVMMIVTAVEVTVHFVTVIELVVWAAAAATAYVTCASTMTAGSVGASSDFRDNSRIVGTRKAVPRTEPHVGLVLLSDLLGIQAVPWPNAYCC